MQHSLSMKLLIFTQKVDMNDPVLGFFHRWIEEFSKSVESIVVICLSEGKHSLPHNVKILSLGKESGISKLGYLKNFYTYIYKYRNDYDKVFVHMNQEYVLLGGLIWKMLQKNVYMWRNHHSGSVLTDIAAYLCAKVFCTSHYSYTAKYKKTVVMPVGIDIELFKKDLGVERKRNSILSLGRFSISKRPDVLIDAYASLITKKTEASLSFYGNPDESQVEFYKKERDRADKISGLCFYDGVSHDMTPQIYQSHEIFVNMSSNGMYDKTIFEAMVSGCLVVVSNENLRGKIPDICIVKQSDVHDLEEKLSSIISLRQDDKMLLISKLREYADKHGIVELSSKLISEIS